jgi:O-antigen/teichoic acid export membrane protein
MTAGWLSYGGILIASSGLSLLKMVIYAKLMTPEHFGIVSLLLGSYAVLVTIGSIGVVDGSLKSASMTRDHDQHSAMMGTALSGGGVTTGIVSAVAVALLGAFDYTIGANLAIGFFFVVLSAFAFNISEIFLRATGRFYAFAWAVFAKSVLSLGLGAAVIYWGHPTGVIATEILAFLLVFLWVQWRLPSPLGFRWPKVSQYVELVKAGFAISVSSLSKKLSFMVDRWMILFLFGPEMLGRYAFLMLFYLLGISAVGVINTAFGPTLLRRMTEQPHRNVISDTAKLVAKLVLPATALVCLAVLTLFQPIAETQFPQYADNRTIYAAALVVTGVGFLAAQALLEWLLIGQHLSHKLIQANVAALLVMVGAIAALASGPGSLLVLCAIFTVARAVSFLLVSWFIFRSQSNAPLVMGR